MRVYRGVSANPLQGYMALYQTKRKYRNLQEVDEFIKVLRQVSITTMTLKWADVMSDSPIY